MPTDNDKEARLILKAELVDKHIVLNIYSKHVPSLSYIKDLIQAKIIEMLVQEEVSQEMKDAPIIHTPGNGSSLGGFMRRIRGK